jgi:signal transduction histidine kinase
MASSDDDFMKAMGVLIHDLRAPLSVATGYLRLIRDERLTSIEDRDRALAGALEAVRRISRLCDEAAEFGSTHGGTELPTMLIGVEDLTARVCAALQSEGAAIEPWSVNSSGYVRVTAADRIASAVARLLRTSLRPLVQDDPVGMDVVADDHALRFLAGTAAERRQLTHNEALPFDPWRGGHGLQLPTACRDLQRVAGRVWTTASTRSAIGVHLPLEARAS